jgi:hypothetical protein
MSRDYIAIPKSERSFYSIDEDFPPNKETPKNSIVAYPIPNISRTENQFITGGGVGGDEA